MKDNIGEDSMDWINVGPNMCTIRSFAVPNKSLALCQVEYYVHSRMHKSGGGRRGVDLAK